MEMYYLIKIVSEQTDTHVWVMRAGGQTYIISPQSWTTQQHSCSPIHPETHRNQRDIKRTRAVSLISLVVSGLNKRLLAEYPRGDTWHLVCLIPLSARMLHSSHLIRWIFISTDLKSSANLWRFHALYTDRYIRIQQTSNQRVTAQY